MPESSKQIIEALNSTTINHYSMVFYIPVVLTFYAVLIYTKKYKIAFAGIAFFLADVFNELVNTIIFYTSNYAPLWGTPLKSSTCWLILPGWCWEIACMFFIAGIPFILSAEGLPKKDSKFLGLNFNQWIVSLIGCSIAVGVEILLNKAGLLTWEYKWWGVESILAVIPIFIFGYFWFFYFAFIVFNMKTHKKRLYTLGTIITINIILVIISKINGWC